MNNPINIPSVDNPMHQLNEVAAMFGVHTHTVRSWIKEEKISGTKIGNRWFISHSEIVRLANEEYGDRGVGTKSD